MVKTETSTLEHSRRTLLLSKAALDDLVLRLNSVGFIFKDIDIDRTDGRSAQDLSLAALEALDGGWWSQCEKVVIRFAADLDKGNLSLSLERPKQKVLNESITVYVRSENHGAVLAGAREVHSFIREHPTSSPLLLTYGWFWLLLSFLANSHLFPSLSSHSFVNYVSYFLIAFALFMYFWGARRFFPRVQIALGKGDVAVGESIARRSAYMREAWGIAKLVLAAVLGAVAKSWFDKHKL